MALNLYAWIEMEAAESTRIHLYGDQLQGVSTDKSNLIYKVAQMVFERAGVSHPELEISMYSEIPLTRGLGSSASAIIGGMAAANAMIGDALSQQTLFELSTELEQHPDNVGASLFGGIVVASWDGERADHITLEPHERLEVVVAIPEFHLATEKARLVLPQQVPMKDAVYNVAHSSLLVAALATGQLDMIQHAMKDALHQPYRAELIPGMAHILAEATQHGALGIALSGAGPTLLAFVDTAASDSQRLETFLRSTLQEQGIEARLLRLKPEQSGVTAAVVEANDSRTFMEQIKGEVTA
jgi:homoserine kinase